MSEQTLFEELKDLRIRKGLRLQQLSEDLKIQIKYLEALEQGDLLKIPEVYDKLFFRSYLAAIGGAEQEYYDRFLEYRRSLRVDKTTTIINFIRPEELEKKFVTSKMVLVILPLIIVVLLLWFLINNTVSVSTPAGTEVAEIDIQKVLRDMDEKRTVPQDSVEQAATDSIGLNLQISGIKKTWFRVIADKQDTSEYLLGKGEQVNLMAEQYFEFLIGRADGLNMKLNGQNILPAGADSSVVRYMRIDSSGIAEKKM